MILSSSGSLSTVSLVPFFEGNGSCFFAKFFTFFQKSGFIDNLKN